MNRIVLALVALAAALAAGGTAAQTSYPQRTIRIFVGYPPGVAPDLVSRILGDRFSETWGQPVVTENVPGAASNVATERVARMPPDGYNLLMGGNSSLVINPSLYDKLPFDPVKDFSPISQIFIAPNILVVHPDVPAKSIPELVALARAHPGQLTYGSAGIGTSQHLAAELFKSIEHLDIRHVPYRGSTGVLPDLLAGRLTMSFTNISTVLPLLREGKLRAFAITSPKRSPAAPDIPTMAESGYPGFDATAWFGLMAPAGTPRPIIDRIHRETVRVMALPEVKKRFDDLGLLAVGNSPEELAAVIAAETPQWAKVIKNAAIKIGE
jgi:tripartite-type tricarboxylate transporter receptor subunit TctC